MVAKLDDEGGLDVTPSRLIEPLYVFVDTTEFHKKKV